MQWRRQRLRRSHSTGPPGVGPTVTAACVRWYAHQSPLLSFSHRCLAERAGLLLAAQVGGSFCAALGSLGTAASGGAAPLVGARIVVGAGRAAVCSSPAGARPPARPPTRRESARPPASTLFLCFCAVGCNRCVIVLPTTPSHPASVTLCLHRQGRQSRRTSRTLQHATQPTVCILSPPLCIPTLNSCDRECLVMLARRRRRR
eukprot:SAG11_NODE_1155_length_5660_cov_6.290955_4_plen_203_part_00